MNLLINDLLAYSRVNTRDIQFAGVSLQQACAYALDNLHGSISESGAEIAVGALPEVVGDGAQLMQVFQNLIGNAIKFQNERPPEIHVSAREEPGQWVLGVRDNGIGIEPQYFEQIFQIFRRLHTRKEYSGTGIGLAICKKIVERQGGRIWVESQPGRGSTFYFSIPDRQA